MERVLAALGTRRAVKGDTGERKRENIVCDCDLRLDVVFSDALYCYGQNEKREDQLGLSSYIIHACVLLITLKTYLFSDATTKDFFSNDVIFNHPAS